MSSNRQKADRAWNRAQHFFTLRMDESQTGAYYDHLALEDFCQMTEGEKEKLPAGLRQEYKETISNMVFVEQERLKQLGLLNAN